MINNWLTRSVVPNVAALSIYQVARDNDIIAVVLFQYLSCHEASTSR